MITVILSRVNKNIEDKRGVDQGSLRDDSCYVENQFMRERGKRC